MDKLWDLDVEIQLAASQIDHGLEIFIISEPHRGECIIVCVKAKFVDTVRARSGHPIGGFIPTWQNAK